MSFAAGTQTIKVTRNALADVYVKLTKEDGVSPKSNGIVALRKLIDRANTEAAIELLEENGYTVTAPGAEEKKSRRRRHHDDSSEDEGTQFIAGSD